MPRHALPVGTCHGMSALRLTKYGPIDVGMGMEGFRGRAAKGAVATCKQTVRSAQLVVG